MSPDEPRITLGSTGCVYVTMQAAEDDADARGLQDEEARKREEIKL